MKKKYITTDEKIKIEHIPCTDGSIGYLRFENQDGDYLFSIDRDDDKILKLLNEFIASLEPRTKKRK